MKKKLLTLLSFMLLFTLTLPVLASDNTVDVKTDIPYSDFSITLPEGGWIAITRDTPVDDPDLKRLGVSMTDLLASYKEINLYLDCINKSSTRSLNVKVIEEKGKDYSSLSDDELLAIGKSYIENQDTPYAYTYEDPSVYKSDKETYLVYKKNLFYSNKNYYYIHYITVKDNINYCVTLASLNQEVFSEKEASDLQASIDSMNYKANSTFIYQIIIVALLVAVGIIIIIGIISAIRFRKKSKTTTETESANDDDVVDNEEIVKED